MAVKSFLQRFRKLDAYAKPLEDVRIRTMTGASGTFNNSFGSNRLEKKRRERS